MQVETPAAVSSPLPPFARPVEFAAEDGQQLFGMYFPGEVNPSPIVVLMHWAPGDMNEWWEIAYWLQNRGMSGSSDLAGTEPWLDATWFPALEPDESYGVFIFTFRGCHGGCKQFSNDWLLDARAAMQTASQLEGADPSRIVAAGASIGADGAADACTGACLGSFSISPGNYLNVPYSQAVIDLSEKQPPASAVCLTAEQDRDSYATCSTVVQGNYTFQTYPGSDHGLSLIDEEMQPNPLELLRDFLRDSLSGSGD